MFGYVYEQTAMGTHSGPSSGTIKSNPGREFYGREFAFLLGEKKWEQTKRDLTYVKDGSGLVIQEGQLSLLVLKRLMVMERRESRRTFR